MYKIKGNIYVEIQFNKNTVGEAFFCESIDNDAPFVVFNNVAGCNYDPVKKVYTKDGESCGGCRAYLAKDIHKVFYKIYDETK